MNQYKIKTTYKQMLADTTTPVSIYLRLRDKYVNSILLESSDSHGSENSFSFICCKPIAGIKLENGIFTETFPDNTFEQTDMSNAHLPELIDNFIKKFNTDNIPGLDFSTNGLFGYMTYDTIQYYESINIPGNTNDRSVPDLCYNFYQYIIAINHFKEELYIIHNTYEDAEGTENKENLSSIEYLIRSKDFPVYQFSSDSEEVSNFKDDEFIEQLNKVKQHCYRGDVFQLVLSRRFSRKFRGDEFNVYRALRSINPSPYLFYFDYGSYKIFGSSPEAQLVIKNDMASIFPIAGTFKRTGKDDADLKLATELLNDPKENAEHVMLVDLARNDLSRNCSEVAVEQFREIQYYSHVIHLVSKVSGRIKEGVVPIKLVADTFPAGTLTGAPKYRAMEIINEYERGNRGYYGGCIGFMGFNGSFNHAIMIRSFLSKNNTLYYQAGAGVVAQSKAESELQEINNKLMALKNALKMAEEIA